MKTLNDILKEIFTIDNIEPEITISTQPQFGHYQCNSAMKQAKLLSKPPREVAETIISKIAPNDIIEHLEIKGPGFINIWIKKDYLNDLLNQQFHDSRLGIDCLLKKEKIIIDFSSPNTAKEMHVGHLRSTIIGDSLCRLFEFLGYEVMRLNHIGDFGTSFGMLITYIKKFHTEILEQATSTLALEDLVSWYKLAKKCFDEDPLFEKAAQMEVVALQNQEANAKAIWSAICEISRRAYEAIYKILDVTLKERGESYYGPYLAPLVKELENRNVVQISNGAKCVFIEGFKNKEGEMLPFMVQKSDGGFNYDTTDLAALKQRIEEEKANRIIYVVDAGQSTHFQLLFEVAKKAGFLDPQKVKTEHVPFGLVLGNDGKKFRTRSGETVKLIDLLDKAVQEAQLIVEQRNLPLDPEQLKQLATILGINAVKYADLSVQRTQDYTFSFERMLKFEGNTAAFLMYSYVRVCSLERKLGKAIDRPQAKIVLEHPSEIQLGLHLLRFQEILNQVSKDLYPHRLCEYLYLLAEKFNAFFRDCRVEGSQEESSRLLLASCAGRVLKTGMEILGLKTSSIM